MGYYMNDSELGCIYMYLSGLHYIHVLYGTITLGASSNSIHSLGLPPIYTSMLWITIVSVNWLIGYI